MQKVHRKNVGFPFISLNETIVKQKASLEIFSVTAERWHSVSSRPPDYECKYCCYTSYSV